MIVLTPLEISFLVVCILGFVVCILGLMTIPVCIGIEWIETYKKVKERRRRAQGIPNPEDMEHSVRWKIPNFKTLLKMPIKTANSSNTADVLCERNVSSQPRVSAKDKQSTNLTETNDATSSIVARACRICHSQLGPLIRPCKCAGSIGYVHESCLSTSVAISMKKECDTCKEKFANKGFCIKKISQWSRPNFGVVECVLMLGITFIVLFVFHGFDALVERVSLSSSYDAKKFFVVMGLFTMFSFIFCLYYTVIGIYSYIKSQTEYRFVNREIYDV